MLEFDSEKFKKLLETGLDFLKETFREFVSQREQLAYERGLDRGAKNTLAALYAGGIGDYQIELLMKKYWEMSPEDVRSQLFLEKRIAAHMAVSEYLSSQGKSPSEIQAILSTKLDCHSDLWIFWREPGKLMDELDKLKP